MAKTFAPRVSKRNRKTLDMSDKLSRDLLSKLSEDRLLKGATLTEIFLADIEVKEQVRTKFNDNSIKELAKNIESNGLIQPLVLHKRVGKYRLICGERRFRAMSLIEMEKAPCFVLDSKSEEELMAIQFSENSSREALHYIDKADGILNYQKATKASERKIQAALGISKSEVHRSLLIAKMSSALKEAAKIFDIEKYVLLECEAMAPSPLKKTLQKKIVEGVITKRAQLKKALRNGGVVTPGKRTPKVKLPRGLTASAFLKAMDSRTKDMNLDKETIQILKNLVSETKEIVDF